MEKNLYEELKREYGNQIEYFTINGAILKVKKDVPHVQVGKGNKSIEGILLLDGINGRLRKKLEEANEIRTNDVSNYYYIPESIGCRYKQQGLCNHPGCIVEHKIWIYLGENWEQNNFYHKFGTREIKVIS